MSGADQLASVPASGSESPQAVPAEDIAVAGLIGRLKAATMRTDWNNLPDDACIPAVPLLRQAAAALTSLSAERDLFSDQSNNFQDRLVESEAEATSLRRKLEEHRKALEPFAAIANEYADHEDDDFQVWKDFDVLGATLPLKYFRVARRTLSGASE